MMTADRYRNFTFKTGYKLATAILFLSALMLSLPPAADAETIGVIITRYEIFQEKAHNAFTSYLSEKGYKDRFKFIVQRPHPDPIAWSNASRKLIAADVDFIVAYGAPVTLSVLKERPKIPVIFADVYEPTCLDLKKRGATGVCSKLSLASLLRYLKGASSGENVGVLYSSLEEDSKIQYMEIIELAKKYGLNIKPLDIHNPLDTAGIVTGAEVESLLITSSSLVHSVYPTIMRIAGGKKLPTASLLYHDSPMPIIMMTANPEEHGQEAAAKLIELIKGSSPGKIPITYAKKVELIFNVREANALGIRISMDLVTEATRIIY